MKWKSFLIMFIVTSVLAIVSLVSCGRPEPVVQEQQTETSVTVNRDGTDVEKDDPNDPVLQNKKAE